jgi:hypothetical protein
VSPSVEHESQFWSLAQAVLAASLRGVRFGAVIGSGVGVVVMLSAFIGGIWSQWHPGSQLMAPSTVMVAKILAYVVVGALVSAAYGAALGAVSMDLFAAFRHCWRRDA